MIPTARKHAYQDVFGVPDSRVLTWIQGVLARFTMRRSTAYARVFGDADVRARRIVLGDLAGFCHANNATFVINDPGGRASAQLDGKRQVWLRINGYVGLSHQEIADRIREARTQK